MQLKNLHPWNVSVERAIQIQEELRPRIIQEDEIGKVHLVVGVDVGFEYEGDITRAGVALLRLPTLEIVETITTRQETNFPYVPGLLSFREAPAISEGLSRLGQTPDLMLCDGHGLAHPRRFGLACHLGLISGIPTIGVAKSRLTGQHKPVREERGSHTSLKDEDEVIGKVLRTRSRVKPVYVSIGHRVSLDSAIEKVLECAPKYRLPEPIRQAHKLASG